MSMRKIWAASLLGMALATSALNPVTAETLRVMQGAASSALNVPMNRAVVVESDVAFAELSIANPGIADISTLSDKTIYVLGKAPGRTTMTSEPVRPKLASSFLFSSKLTLTFITGVVPAGAAASKVRACTPDSLVSASSIRPALASRAAAEPGPVTVHVSAGFSPAPAFFWNVTISGSVSGSPVGGATG